MKSTSGSSLILENAMNKLFYQKMEQHEDRVGMHGSGIIASDNEFCYRQQVLSFFYKGFEPDFPIRLRRIFSNGWFVHEKWQKMFKDAGIASSIEQRGMSNDMRLLFTPDAVVKLNGTKYVVEIKSMNTYQFQKAKSHPSGEKQCQLYMHMLAIPRGFVLVEDKNTQDIKTFPVEYDPLVVRPFVERMLKVQEYIKVFECERKMPKRICRDEDTKRACSCAYKEACFGIKRIKLKKGIYTA